MKPLQQRILLSLFVSIALILHFLEGYVPTPAPWLKLGAANIVSLLALYLFGIRAALLVTIFRVLLGALLRGTLLGPTFYIAFGSAVSAVLVMGLLRHLAHRWFSVIGISIWGALTFNIAQITIAYYVLIHRVEIFHFLPMMLMFTPFTGLLTGLAAQFIIRRSHVLLMEGHT